MEEQLSPLALAFIGDAIHTAYVREEVLKGKHNKLSNYHNLAKRYCNAKKQMETLEAILPSLRDEEREVVRKARNSHSKHTAKNFDEETYKKATAFEALVGFLHLTQQNDRLNEILKISMKEE
ncbi:MAG: Mini-ribonuclease 3 [Clostridia bacterium]|nr:Mini-ribonuclease 3 [Clostridia bacterium]